MLADEPQLDVLVEAYEWDTPLRVAAAFHYLVLGRKASWEDAPADVLQEHAATLRRFLTEQGVQTNEVQRCWMLLPCFLEGARRAGAAVLDLIELGPSAGLNLLWDRYRYRYEAGSWGPGNALLELEGEERGSVPAELLALQPRVRSRIGIDVAPIDVRTDEGARLLKAFVWPDQISRLRRLDEAIAAVRAEPPDLLRADIVTELPRVLAAARPDALTLVWHTAVLGYLSRADRKRVYATLEEAGARTPLAFVQTTVPGDAGDNAGTYYGLALRVWPGDGREEIAYGDFHGAWLDWHGSTP